MVICFVEGICAIFAPLFDSVAPKLIWGWDKIEHLASIWVLEGQQEKGVGFLTDMFRYWELFLHSCFILL